MLRQEGEAPPGYQIVDRRKRRTAEGTHRGVAETRPERIPVRMQTGDSPVTVIGWVSSSDAVPDLLENIAAQLREMIAARANS